MRICVAFTHFSLLLYGACAVSMEPPNTRKQFLKGESTKKVRVEDSGDNPPLEAGDFSWLDCRELVSHIGTLVTHVGMNHPHNTPGYSSGRSCDLLYDTMKKQDPRGIDAIVNLSTHIRERRELLADTKVADVATRRRRSLIFSGEPSFCDSDRRRAAAARDLILEKESSNYKMSSPGVDAETLAHPIKSMCPDATCPTLESVLFQPKTCISQGLVPNYANDDIEAFEEFRPDYPGGGEGAFNAYRLYVLSLESPSDFDPLWTGCDQDRVDEGDYNVLAAAQTAYFALQLTTLTNEVICENIDEAIEVGIFFGVAVAVPNPFKIACVAVLTIFRLAELGLETFVDQITFHSGGVNSAEIQAGYLHTINLLDKQCSIFYEAACRCSAAMESRGTGCDGLDSNCDGTPDDCDEDQYSPEIDISSALAACSKNGKWFLDSPSASDCVTKATMIQDDCDKDTKIDTAVIEVTGTCQNAEVSLSTTDACGNAATAAVPVFIDEEPPVVSCNFLRDDGSTTDSLQVWNTGGISSVNLQYSATDNCGGDLDVTVDVFANELESLRPKESAVLFENGLPGRKVDLFLEYDICNAGNGGNANVDNTGGGNNGGGNGNANGKNAGARKLQNNGQCLVDPMLEENRLYTVVVSTTDQAGRSAASATCTVLVTPCPEDIEVCTAETPFPASPNISNSKQRFFLTSYTSTFQNTAPA